MTYQTPHIDKTNLICYNIRVELNVLLLCYYWQMISRKTVKTEDATLVQNKRS